MTPNVNALNAVVRRKVMPSDHTKIIDFFKLNRFSFQKSLIKSRIREINPEIRMQEINVYSQQTKI